MRTNYPAVVVCAVVYWLLGGLWFGLFFNKPWMALEHITEAQAKSAHAMSFWLFIITFALNLVIAFTLAQLCTKCGRCNCSRLTNSIRWWGCA